MVIGSGSRRAKSMRIRQNTDRKTTFCNGKDNLRASQPFSPLYVRQMMFPLFKGKLNNAKHTCIEKVTLRQRM
jgi:hypothetical protein